jgi:hypothetical protein
MDDTTVSEILIGNVQEQLKSVTEWSKDQVITKTEIPELQAEQSSISRISSYKLLRVWIDNNTNTWA